MAVQFTAPNGTKLWIVAEWITGVRPTLAGELGKTLIYIGAREQYVAEDVNQVLKALEWAS